MSPESPNECYSDYALQEYAAGRLDADIRLQLAEHLATCPECRQAHADLDAESRLLRFALAPVQRAEPEAPFSDETLALYLSGALDESHASDLETALSKQPAYLARLITLHTELAATRAEAEGTAATTATLPEPLGLILKMPRRMRPVATLLTNRQAGGERA